MKNVLKCRLQFALAALMLFLLAACDSDIPTPIPTRTLSGPTTAPTAIFYPDFPTLEANNPGVSDPTVMAFPRDIELPPLVIESASGVQSITLTAGDGTLLTGDLYTFDAAVRVPGVLLIAPDRAAWGDLPLQLVGQGFIVLSMNHRDAAPLGDAIVMLQGIANAPSVDPARIAVIAAEDAADLALVACAGDLLCDALALISPFDALSVGYLSSYLPRPLVIAAAVDDVTFSIADQMAQSAPNQIEFYTVSGQGRGASLAAVDPGLAVTLIELARRVE